MMRLVHSRNVFAAFCKLVAMILVALLNVPPSCAADGSQIQSGSCASATCHGGVVGRGPVWNYSYSVSRSADPHATSGNLLYDADSRLIIAALDPAAIDPNGLAYDLVLRRRCISCHLSATPADITSNKPLDRTLVSQGVDCQSCHGQADDWLDAHVLTTWAGPARYESSTGMLDTESLVGRTDGCIRCHIGSRTADGMVRDMNHDVIAAGHPALRFDLLIYNDNMPHHWDDQSASELAFGASAVTARRVGRSLGLAAAARLSSERAEAAQTQSTIAEPNSMLRVPWPELSDFDCFGCHQSLVPRLYRPPVSTDGETKLQVSDGLPLWNAWFTAMEARAGTDLYRMFKPKPGMNADWIVAANRIAGLHRTRAVQEAAAKPAGGLAQISAIKRSLRAKTPSDWNDAAAIFLDLDAALRDLANQPEWANFAKPAVVSLNENVAPVLRFVIETPSDDSKRLRSPKDFDPRTFREKTLVALDSLE